MWQSTFSCVRTIEKNLQKKNVWWPLLLYICLYPMVAPTVIVCKRGMYGSPCCYTFVCILWWPLLLLSVKEKCIVWKREINGNPCCYDMSGNPCCYDMSGSPYCYEMCGSPCCYEMCGNPFCYDMCGGWMRRVRPTLLRSFPHSVHYHWREKEGLLAA